MREFGIKRNPLSVNYKDFGQHPGILDAMRFKRKREAAILKDEKNPERIVFRNAKSSARARNRPVSLPKLKCLENDEGNV